MNTFVINLTILAICTSPLKNTNYQSALKNKPKVPLIEKLNSYLKNFQHRKFNTPIILLINSTKHLKSKRDSKKTCLENRIGNTF